MNFYERYSTVCLEHGIEPCSQKAATLFGISRSTISCWNTKNTFPNGQTVAAIADALGVSADFLLGRTDDPVDCRTNEDAAEERAEMPTVYREYLSLDEIDRAKVEGYINGLLSAEKYHCLAKAKNA